MGNSNSALSDCLDAVCADRSSCVTYPDDPRFLWWAKPFNLEFPVVPAAVIKPKNADEVSGAVKCAKENDLHVQAKSGGHSYGNFGLGGDDGAVVVDLVNLKDFEMDNKTWRASFGSGMHLGELDEHLHDNGGRAMAHGTCPPGGLGPVSRIWGSALDHVVEVEVVTADGTIRTASETENSDLFWALRGAGASFGIVTKFVVKTHPEPGSVVQYSYNIAFGDQADTAELYKEWQELVADPDLDWRFSSLFVVHPLGALVSGTFFGTEAEFNKTGIADRLPGVDDGDIWLTDWVANLLHEAEVVGCELASIPAAFYSKSMAFRYEDLINETAITDLFDYLDDARSETAPVTIIFNTEGGAIADVPENATAYPHRDKVMMYQSYGIGVGKVSDETRDLLDGVHERILRSAPGARSTYAGYVDPLIDRRAAQELYWADKLPQLRRVKKEWDPDQVFSNPQSVEPAE
ncbi:hypothetical protein FDECE_7612 [Fusarium decemcellulare]|nr:hypothetical protein FDECE_7612 [Fusarium decemcellulare]